MSDLADDLDAAGKQWLASLKAKKPRGEKATKRKSPEADIQRAIVADCRRHLTNGYIAATVATAQGSGTAEQRARYGAKLKSFGVLAGEPDLRAYLAGGITVQLEVKAEKGRLSEAQEFTHANLTSLGHPVYVVRSLTEAREALAKHGARFVGGLR